MVANHRSGPTLQLRISIFYTCLLVSAEYSRGLLLRPGFHTVLQRLVVENVDIQQNLPSPCCITSSSRECCYKLPCLVPTIQAFLAIEQDIEHLPANFECSLPASTCLPSAPGPRRLYTPLSPDLEHEALRHGHGFVGIPTLSTVFHRWLCPLGPNSCQCLQQPWSHTQQNFIFAVSSQT